MLLLPVDCEKCIDSEKAGPYAYQKKDGHAWYDTDF